MTPLKRICAVVACLLLGALTSVASQGPSTPLGPAPPQSERPLIIKSTLGADLYQFYCSSCHGPRAKGGVPRSAESPAPPDLTLLARHNNGVFPRERVREMIRFGPGSSRLAAHGSADMPVWGMVFRALDPNDAVTDIRIENLVAYVAALQEAAAGH